MSSRSLTNIAKRSELFLMMLRKCRCSPANSPTAPINSSSTYPLMDVIGVRNSCETVETNSVLARLASISAVTSRKTETVPRNSSSINTGARCTLTTRSSMFSRAARYSSEVYASGSRAHRATVSIQSRAWFPYSPSISLVGRPSAFSRGNSRRRSAAALNKIIDPSASATNTPSATPSRMA